MARQGAEKELVDAIIDGDVDAQELADRASELGATLAERLTAITKGILLRVRQGQLTLQTAEARYREAYIALSLLGFVQVAGRILQVSERDVGRMRAALKKLGPAVAQVQAIRKADALERAMEKAGVATPPAERDDG